MKTEVPSGNSAMLNWGQKVYPTNIRLCAWNTSVTNSHIIAIYGQHDYSQGFCFPLITKKKYMKLPWNQAVTVSILCDHCVSSGCAQAHCQGLHRHLQAAGDAGTSCELNASVRTAPPEPSSGDWLPSPILEAFTATCRLSAKKEENKSKFKQQIYREAA